MRPVRVLLLAYLVASSGLPARGGEGDTLTSAQIIAQSLDIGCMAWRAVGSCLWMTCVGLVCEFDLSIKVRHNMPDLVVSSYHSTGQNPWLDVAALSPPNALAQDGGSNTEGVTTANEQALRFKNTDAIGSPGTVVYADLAAVSGLICPPGATAFFPYFLSVLDFNWRDPTVETPLTLANALRTIGKGTTNFGPLYPRIGFVNQGHDYKSAVVTARRTADIISRHGQPHVYVPALWGSPQGYWPPGIEGNPLWQQLNPKGQPGCTPLPDIDDTARLDDPYRNRINQSTGYAWHLWRTYRCCERLGDVLIFHEGG